MNVKLQDIDEKMAQALIRLKEVLTLQENDVVRDAAIQRFEFTLELMWKFLYRHLSAKGVMIEQFPRTILEKAFAADWIDEEHMWLNMLADRNRSSHVYSEELAKEIYERIRAYYPLMQHTYDKLRNQHFDGKL